MSIQNIRVPEGWHPIAWTRMFDDLVAVIQVGPDELCIWRVQSRLDPKRKLTNFLGKDASKCRSFQEALHEVELAVKHLASPLHLPHAGLGGLRSTSTNELEMAEFLKQLDAHRAGRRR